MFFLWCWNTAFQPAEMRGPLRHKRKIVWTVHMLYTFACATNLYDSFSWFTPFGNALKQGKNIVFIKIHNLVCSNILIYLTLMYILLYRVWLFKKYFKCIYQKYFYMYYFYMYRHLFKHILVCSHLKQI